MKFVLTLVFAITTLQAATSTDWPRFLGPTGAAIAPESKVPLKWSDSENVVWKAESIKRPATSHIAATGKVSDPAFSPRGA